MVSQNLSNSAQVSQIETNAWPARVVLLGASNLALTLPRVIASARAVLGGPLEFFVAAGCGRSYGQNSKFFLKNFSGILQSEIWSALDRAAPAPTIAIVADVGNDLAYEAPVEQVVEWVTAALDRLAQHDARVALNNIPLASLDRVGALRYALLRAALFPACRLSRSELLHRAQALCSALSDLAETREIPAFSARSDWYGIDPIHPRRRCAGHIWQRMLGALASPTGEVSWAALSRADARALRRARAAYWSLGGAHDPARPVRATLADGATISLF
jgi:hypothetical protein